MDKLPNEYDFVFGPDNGHWSRDYAANTMFLLTIQNYLNQLLHARGHVFLNEVLDVLGLPRTKAGAVTGWLHSGGPIELKQGHDKHDNDPNIAVYISTQGTIYDKIE